MVFGQELGDRAGLSELFKKRIFHAFEKMIQTGPICAKQWSTQTIKRQCIKCTYFQLMPFLRKEIFIHELRSFSDVNVKVCFINVEYECMFVGGLVWYFDGGCEPVGGYARFSGSRQQLQHQPARWWRMWRITGGASSFHSNCTIINIIIVTSFIVSQQHHHHHHHQLH